MPELPEVQTTVNYLNSELKGEVFSDLWTDAEKLLKKPASWTKFKGLIVESEVKNISRRAKYVIFHLSGEKTLVIHQRMSGHLLVGQWRRKNDNWRSVNKKALEDKYNQYLHLIFWFASGKMLALSNLRKFATLRLYNKSIPSDYNKKAGIEELDKLGLEPLGEKFTFERFKQVLEGRRAAIKTILMNQEIIAGIGNIYSDEVLWKAGVDPRNKVNKLDQDKLKKIYRAIPSVLKEALRMEGTSVSDYRKPSGKKGSYAEKLKVYGKEGEQCPRCRGEIERVKISGRSAHFCPQCQS